MRALRAMVGVCCTDRGRLRDWLVDVLPVATFAALEDQLRSLYDVTSLASAAPRIDVGNVLDNVADMLEGAEAAIEPADWWRPLPSEIPDALTSLRTRRVWDADLHRAFTAATEAEPLALLLFDLDLFKSINDQYGHLVGDQVLTAVGATLRRTVGHKGSAYRWGGEELAVLLPNTDEAEARALAWRALHAIRALRFWAEPQRAHRGGHDTTDGRLGVTASVGWALAPSKDVRTAEDLVGLADTRMYDVKNSGRNNVWEQASARSDVPKPAPRLLSRSDDDASEPREDGLLDPYEELRVRIEELFARVTRLTHTTFAPARLFSAVRYPGVDRQDYHQKVFGGVSLGGNDVIDFKNAKTGVCTGELVAIRQILDDFIVLEVPMGGRRVRVHYRFLEPPWEHSQGEIGLNIQGTIIVPEDRSAFLWLEPLQRST